MHLDSEDLLSPFGARTLEKGRALFATLGVLGLEVEDWEDEAFSIEGEVESQSRPGRFYSVFLLVDELGELAEASCSCPAGSYCKHCVALLLSYIAEAGEGGARPGASLGRAKGEGILEPALPASPATGREPELEMLRLETGRVQDLSPSLRALAEFGRTRSTAGGSENRAPGQRWSLAFGISLNLAFGEDPQLLFWKALRYRKRDGSPGRLGPWREELLSEPPSEEDAVYLSRFPSAGTEQLPFSALADLFFARPPSDLVICFGRPDNSAAAASHFRFGELQIDFQPSRWSEKQRRLYFSPRFRLLSPARPAEASAEAPLVEQGECLAALAPGALVLLLPERGLVASCPEPALQALPLLAFLNRKSELSSEEASALSEALRKEPLRPGLSARELPRLLELRRLEPRGELECGLIPVFGGFRFGARLSFRYGDEGVLPHPVPPGQPQVWLEPALAPREELSLEDGRVLIKRRDPAAEGALLTRAAELLAPYSDQAEPLIARHARAGLFPLDLAEEELLFELFPRLLDAGFSIVYKGERLGSARHLSAGIRLEAVGDWFMGRLVFRRPGFEELLEFEDAAEILERGWAMRGGRLWLLEPGDRSTLALLLEGWNAAERRFELPALDFGRLGLAAALADAEGKALLAERLALGKALSGAFSTGGGREEGAESGRIPEEPLPAGLKTRLRPYQKEGYDRLCFLYARGLAALLADDMGLGKTIQALALLLRLKEKGELGRALLVAPLTLLSNWEAEAARFAPSLRLARHHGSGRAREFAAYGQIDLLVTTYQTLRSDRALFAEGSFGFLLLDEAQIVKNPDAAAFAALKAVKAERRLSLTGTPVENRPLELWSQFRLVLPGLLGSRKSFESRFSRPLASGEAEAAAAAAQALRALVSPFIIRRRKEEVLAELPPKEEIVLRLEMEPKQALLYEKLRAEVAARVERSFMERGAGGSAITIFEALLRLRQVAIHPGLFAENWAAGGSIKFDYVEEALLELVAEGHRILVFSQFVAVLARLRPLVERLGIPYEYLDGSTRDRKSVLERFRTGDAPLFLLSLKAGGLGVNLPEADYVLLLDPWWNPAVEAQAIDRAHRIGQTRPVTILKPIVAGTVEERILALQERKRGLVEELIVDSGSLYAGLSEEELRGLFR